MPRTPTPRAAANARTEILADLKDDHRRFKMACEQFKDLNAAGEPARCEECVQRVLGELILHGTLEEDLLYPAVHGVIADPSLIDEARVEHKVMRVLIEQLQSLALDDHKFIARFTELCDYVLHHSKEEESEMFRQLERATLDWESLRDEMAERRAELGGGLAGELAGEWPEGAAKGDEAAEIEPGQQSGDDENAHLANAGAPPRPALRLLGTEPWRAASEFLVHTARRLRRRKPLRPPGDGHPVVVFPGLASDGRAVGPLRDHCQALGYEAIDWGQGFNIGPDGDVDAWLARLAHDLISLLDKLPDVARGQAPTLIGWSLGGIYARELAKRSDFPVRQVITIGTPFNGSSDQTHAGWLYKLLNRRASALEPAQQQRLSEPPPVPTTSIYSRGDGIVAWQACRHDQPHGEVHEIEVAGSHLGMGWNERVLKVVGERLAAVPAVVR